MFDRPATPAPSVSRSWTVRSVLGAGLIALASAAQAQIPSFGAPSSIFLNTNPHFVAVADLNHDTFLDLVVAVEATVPSRIYVLLGNGAGAFAPGPDSPIDVRKYPVCIAVGDLNGDTHPDLAVANSANVSEDPMSSNISILLGDGAGEFTEAAGSPVTAGSQPYWVAIANMNADATPDLVVANSASNSVSVLIGSGSAAFNPPVNIAVGAAPRSLVVADFNGDTFKDIAVGNNGEALNHLSVLLGTDATGTAFAAPVSYSIGGQGTRSLVLTDLNGDTRPDIVAANQTTSNVSVLLASALGNGTFSLAGTYSSAGAETASGAFGVNAGDFNGDAMSDIVVTNLNRDFVTVFTGDGAGGLTSPRRITAGQGTLYPGVGDFNGDTRPDLAISNYGTGNVNVFLNTPGVLADIAVSASGPATASAGGAISYTVNLTNIGPSTSADVWLNEVAPAGFVFTGGTGPCTSLPCHIGAMPASPTPVTVTLSYTIAPDYAGANPAVSTSYVNTSTGDGNTANDLGTVSTTITPAVVEIGVAKSGPPTVVAGENVVYTLTVTNTGPHGAAGVVLADPTPTGLTFVGSTGGCASFPCTIGNVANGANLIYTATYGVPHDYAGPNPIVNTATVTTTSADTGASNNTANTSTTVTTSANLAVAKTGPASLAAGQNLVYTITVSNAGPSSAAGVSIANPTPAGLTFVSSSNGCTSFPCALGTVAPGPGTPFAVTYSVPAGYSGANPIVNTATVSTTTNDPSGANNTASVSTNVTFSADLQVTKTGPATVARGQNLTYTIAVRNNGPSDAGVVTVNDPTPAGLTFVSTSGDCTSAFPCALGPMTSGQTKTITATFLVPAGYAGATTISNTATVSTQSPVSDPTAGNNSSEAETDVVLASDADLTITKTGPANVYRGGLATYTITVLNNGPATAANVQVADVTPTGLTFVSTSSPCAVTTSFPCALGSMTPGLTRTFTATFSVPAGYAGPEPVLNTATVSSTTADPDTTNNSSTASSGVDRYSLYTVAPCRLLDTREAPAAPALAPGTVRTFTLVGSCGIPSEARSVSVNITVAGPTDAGDLRIYPSGSPLPGSSSINFSAGQTRANNAIMPLGAGGAIDVVTSQATGNVHFILDVNGYMAP
jgi:uncharacterized repeat protein (TIGR01451 family)